MTRINCQTVGWVRTRRGSLLASRHHILLSEKKCMMPTSLRKEVYDATATAIPLKYYCIRYRIDVVLRASRLNQKVKVDDACVRTIIKNKINS